MPRAGTLAAVMRPTATRFARRSPAAVAAASFTPAAVSLTPYTPLRTAGALGITESPRGTYSFWMRAGYNNAAITDTADWNPAVGIVFGSDPSPADPGGNTEGTRGLNILVDNAGNSRGTLRANWADAASTVAAQATNNFQPIGTALLQDAGGDWVHCLCSWDLSGAPAARRFAFYLNGMRQAGFGGGINNGAGGFNVGANTRFAVNYWGDAFATLYTGQKDLAQLFIDHSASIVQADNTIASADLAKFYNGGPVDVAATLPLGRAPDQLYDGDRTSFATNRGRLGSAADLAVFGLIPRLANAGFGPGTPPARPAHRWTADSGTAPLGNGLTSRSVHTGGNKPALGDLMVLALQFVDTDGVARTHGVTTPAGWTLLTNAALDQGGTNWGVDVWYFYRFADATDVAAGRNAAWSFGWATAATRSATWAMLCYRGAIAIAGGLQGNAAGMSPASPSRAAPANSVVISALHAWTLNSAAAGFGTVTGPAVPDLRYARKPDGSGSVPQLQLFDEFQAAAGVTTPRAWTFGVARPCATGTIVVS